MAVEDQEPQGNAGSQEPEEKPKLNLTVHFEDQQITVKVRANMKLAKIFEAVEKKFDKDPRTLKFLFDEQRLNGDDTPAGVGMADGDQIDAFLEQVGGALL